MINYNLKYVIFTLLTLMKIIVIYFNFNLKNIKFTSIYLYIELIINNLSFNKKISMSLSVFAVKNLYHKNGKI
jgi:hypothetical protein